MNNQIPKILTENDCKKIQAMVADLLTNSEIAEVMGYSASTIDRFVRAMDDQDLVRRRNQAVKSRRRPSDEQLIQAQCLLDLGATKIEVSQTIPGISRIIHTFKGRFDKPRHISLEDPEIEAMRKDYQNDPRLSSCRALGRKYGVSHDTAARIVRGLQPAKRGVRGPSPTPDKARS